MQTATGHCRRRRGLSRAATLTHTHRLLQTQEHHMHQRLRVCQPTAITPGRSHHVLQRLAHIILGCCLAGCQRRGSGRLARAHSLRPGTVHGASLGGTAPSMPRWASPRRPPNRYAVSTSRSSGSPRCLRTASTRRTKSTRRLASELSTSRECSGWGTPVRPLHPRRPPWDSRRVPGKPAQRRLPWLGSTRLPSSGRKKLECPWPGHLPTGGEL